MARATKILTNLNDEIVISDIDEINGAAAVQYGVGGLGTIVLEVSSLDNAAGVAEWITVPMTDQILGSAISNLAAAGRGWAEIVGAAKVRVRKSVAGAGPVRASLSVNNS